MAVNKVDLYVSQILEDLDNGLTWLKRDDVGYGSIQEKYNAKDQQITMIRKHPKLKDAETNITVFNIIDDTDERNTTVSADRSSNAENVENVPGNIQPESRAAETLPQSVGQTNEFVPAGSAEEELAAFASL